MIEYHEINEDFGLIPKVDIWVVDRKRDNNLRS